MPDTYLREAQLMVLRGQESCMAYLRSGGDFGGLVSSVLVGSGPPPGDVAESASVDGQGADGLDSHGGDAPAEAERLRAKARLAGLQQEFTGAAGDAFNADLFDAGFDKRGVQWKP